MADPWKDVCALIDSKGRIKEFSRGRELLLHNDFFRDEAPPYRVVSGEEAERLYRDHRAMRSKRFVEMLSDPEYAEMAQRTIARMKERGVWIDPEEAAARSRAGTDGTDGTGERT